MFKGNGKRYHIAGIMVCLLILGCNQRQRPGEPLNKTAEPGEAPHSIAANDTIYAGGMDTTVYLNDGEAFVIGHIIANKSRPRYTLAARKGQTVTALLKPLKKGGNVRINQVQEPGGTFDGPFGDSLSYTFKRGGNIRIIIGENLMAGNPYTGDFMLHIILK